MQASLSETCDRLVKTESANMVLSGDVCFTKIVTILLVAGFAFNNVVLRPSLPFQPQVTTLHYHLS